MTRTVDLNELRRTMAENRQRDDILPANLDDKVFVDRDGNIVRGKTLAPGEGQHLSEVQQGILATSNWRREQEQQIVREKLPHSTRELTVSGLRGWHYSVVDQFGQYYEMFAYHDGSLYQVQVISPEVEGRYSPHVGHLFRDGRICFGEYGGIETLDAAYAKSVIWANGFTIFDRTGDDSFLGLAG